MFVLMDARICIIIHFMIEMLNSKIKIALKSNTNLDLIPSPPFTRPVTLGK